MATQEKTCYMCEDTAIHECGYRMDAMGKTCGNPICRGHVWTVKQANHFDGHAVAIYHCLAHQVPKEQGRMDL